MRPLHPIAHSLLVAVGLALPTAIVATAAMAQGLAARPAPVEIALQSEVRADGPVIRLGHVAQTPRRRGGPAHGARRSRPRRVSQWRGRRRAGPGRREVSSAGRRL